MRRWESVLLGTAGFLLVIPGIRTDLFGLLAAAVIITRQLLIRRKQRAEGSAEA